MSDFSWDDESLFVSTMKETLKRKGASKSLISTLSKIAIRNANHYVSIMGHVEGYIEKVQPSFRLNGLYILDSILKNAKSKLGKGNVYQMWTSKNIHVILRHVFRCQDSDFEKVVKVLNIWVKESHFGDDVLSKINTIVESIVGKPLLRFEKEIIAPKVVEMSRNADGFDNFLSNLNSSRYELPGRMLGGYPGHIHSRAEAEYLEYRMRSRSDDFYNDRMNDRRFSPHHRGYEDHYQYSPPHPVRRDSYHEDRYHLRIDRSPDYRSPDYRSHPRSSEISPNRDFHYSNEPVYHRRDPYSENMYRSYSDDRLQERYSNQDRYSDQERFSDSDSRYDYENHYTNSHNDTHNDPHNDHNRGIYNSPEESSEPQMISCKSKTLFIGNISSVVTFETLETLFKSFGRIVKFKYLPERHFAFITYETREQSEMAKFHVKTIQVDGRILKVGWARPLEVSKDNFNKETGELIIPKNSVPSYQTEVMGDGNKIPLESFVRSPSYDIPSPLISPPIADNERIDREKQPGNSERGTYNPIRSTEDYKPRAEPQYREKRDSYDRNNNKPIDSRYSRYDSGYSRHYRSISPSPNRTPSRYSKSIAYRGSPYNSNRISRSPPRIYRSSSRNDQLPKPRLGSRSQSYSSRSRSHSKTPFKRTRRYSSSSSSSTTSTSTSYYSSSSSGKQSRPSSGSSYNADSRRQETLSKPRSRSRTLSQGRATGRYFSRSSDDISRSRSPEYRKEKFRPNDHIPQKFQDELYRPIKIQTSTGEIINNLKMSSMYDEKTTGSDTNDKGKYNPMNGSEQKSAEPTPPKQPSPQRPKHPSPTYTGFDGTLNLFDQENPKRKKRRLE